MTPNEYIQLVLRTEGTRHENKEFRLEHGTFGICTESGELADTFKRFKFYNQPYDDQNAAEELGDLCWYMSLMIDALGLTWEEVWEANIAKLKKRYPEQYTDHDALESNRDRVAEQKAAACNKEKQAQMLRDLQEGDRTQGPDPRESLEEEADANNNALRRGEFK